ncbi:MAG: creatininase family protein [Piscinibacter sp.]|uniref:creatininase family protein n=1 Tax=Piscinibacter sp. TaxID=1903157 RepID=UPI002583782C|nr:creatininase family protein [Piscinibacter sp.]MCW5663067.1 creatininase family protein [Piscinibacter sp.]
MGLALAAASAGAAPPVELEQLTWTELRERVAGGATVALVPLGGTEQNGPHMVLGKHNVRVRVLAGRIARELGNAIVAPVLAYVPEGSIEPPQAHMRWPGTISIPEPAFEALLDGSARSLCRAGFRDVVLLPDHGGYLKSIERVAARPGRPAGCRVHALLDYYRATQGAYVAALAARGYRAEEIGSHAGLADTSLALAADPALVRSERLAQTGPGEGVVGDPRRSSVELGQLGLDQVVAASVAAIRARLRGQ